MGMSNVEKLRRKRNYQMPVRLVESEPLISMDVMYT